MSSFGSFVLWTVFFILLFSIVPWIIVPLFLVMLIAFPFYLMGAMVAAMIPEPVVEESKKEE